MRFRSCAPAGLPLIPTMAHRYRIRTELRGMLRRLGVLVPKGRRDCGNHEWYRSSDEIDRCYHCDVGVRPHPPKPDSSPPAGVLAR